MIKHTIELAELDAINIKEQFGSMRMIAVLTPNTFTRKMIIVSTIWNTPKCTGQTAIKQVEELNNLTIKDYNSNFEIIQEHKKLGDALRFHFETINSKGFSSCDEINGI